MNEGKEAMNGAGARGGKAGRVLGYVVGKEREAAREQEKG